jgi:hypothetical protein
VVHLMRQEWCIGLQLPVQLRANNQNNKFDLTRSLIPINLINHFD